MKPAVLILGATGTVGSATVQVALDAGWPVVAVARDRAGLDALRRRHPGAKLQAIAGNVTDDAGARALLVELQKIARPFIGVIAALGAGDARGRLLEQPASELRHSFEDAVVPHLVAARHLLPWLADSGRNCGYVVVGGPGGRNPWSGYGHRSIAAAALRMLARVLNGEAQAYAVRLQLLEVESPVRTDANEKHACKQWPCASNIGRKALELLLHRNDTCCSQPVIDFRSDTCGAPDVVEPDGSDVEKPQPASSDEQGRLVTEPGPPQSQEMDIEASLLPARCLQDARKLLDDLASPPNPTNKNQERTK